MLVGLLFPFVAHLFLEFSFDILLAGPHIFLVVGNLHFVLIEFVAEVEGADMILPLRFSTLLFSQYTCSSSSYYLLSPRLLDQSRSILTSMSQISLAISHSGHLVALQHRLQNVFFLLGYYLKSKHFTQIYFISYENLHFPQSLVIIFEVGCLEERINTVEKGICVYFGCV